MAPSGTRTARSRLASRLAREKGSPPELAAALRAVPRKEFLEGAMATHWDDDTALPIGYRQTTSQPTVIAVMLGLMLKGSPSRGKVLEVGCGCGYQTALLAEIYEEVFAVDRLRPLAELTRANLRRLGYNNVRVKHADGIAGLGKAGLMDGIIVSAAAPEIPAALVDQLRPGARLVLPLEVGPDATRITVLEKNENDEITRKEHDYVSFVPLLGGVEG